MAIFLPSIDVKRDSIMGPPRVVKGFHCPILLTFGDVVGENRPMPGRPLTKAKYLQELSAERDLTEEEEAQRLKVLGELGLPSDHVFDLTKPPKPEKEKDKPEPAPPPKKLTNIDWDTIDPEAILPYSQALELSDEAGQLRRQQMNALIVGIMHYGIGSIGLAALEYNAQNPQNPVALPTVLEWMDEKTTVDGFNERAVHADTIFRASLTARLISDADNTKAALPTIALNNAFNPAVFKPQTGKKAGDAEKQKVNSVEMYKAAVEAGKSLMEFSGEAVPE